MVIGRGDHGTVKLEEILERIAWGNVDNATSL